MKVKIKELAIILAVALGLIEASANNRYPFGADSTLTISQKGMLAASLEYSFFNSAFSNPAVRQYQMPISVSEIHLSYRDVSTPHFTTTIAARGERGFNVGASTYIKHKASTLWGNAYYQAGHQLGLKWNETSDAELLYPYLTADSVGGDMHLERYRFLGGYADHKGRWNWGAEIGYLAGLYYRNVDPRPKNITGRLSIKAGAGYAVIPHYSLSLGLLAERYQQSNEITFMSETYESKIFHATGLGTHYVRFAGTGKNSKYSGWRYGASLQWVPSDSAGFIANANFNAFNFEKILTDLNRLPLVNVSDLDLVATLGYRTTTDKNRWMIAADFYSHSRKGKENIFGDPSMSIYPQIASLQKYNASLIKTKISALWSLWKNRMPKLSICPTLEYIDYKESYKNPNRSVGNQSLLSSLQVQTNIQLPWQIDARITVHGSLYSPIWSECSNDGLHLNDDQGLTDAWLYDCNFYNSNSGDIAINIALIRPLNKRFALQLAASYSHLFLPSPSLTSSSPSSANQWDISLSLLF